MKTGLKVWTAISAFAPLLFFGIYALWVLGYALLAYIRSDDIPSGVMAVITILLLLFVGFYYFNLIFDTVYIIKSHRFKDWQMILWILLSFFFGAVSAPVFWCIYIRTADKNAPMFPPKETTL